VEKQLADFLEASPKLAKRLAVWQAEDAKTSGHPMFAGSLQMAAGVVAGFAIGVVASLLGVAGGELLIPILILLFGVDVKLARSLSLAVNLPTMLVGFARYSLDGTFAVLRRNGRFVVAIAVGSVVHVIRAGGTTFAHSARGNSHFQLPVASSNQRRCECSRVVFFS
jgi:hypothetical protein